MYKNNDEAIDLEAKRLLDNGIYTDLEKAYSEAEKIITEIRVEFKKEQEKKQFRSRIKSIKRALSDDEFRTNIPYNHINQWSK
ncbi:MULTISPECIES: hypothetical protein [Enterobacterales]|uniref:hypothetical protein n=1 Tax=Enterobacterales TaxID=91347 RepID=UPI000CD2C50D|nr:MULTISPECIES: hypothetical protein [Enterobacterales]POV36655.1 hypothetical protein C3388_05120 [Leclercia sp. LSNIH5]POW68402.1 hypothetical protein C3389_01325 [Leclercia sp. LSNIH2]HCB3605243.1 hypothetical protein [Klebsiella aerogenes]AUU86360.1 hypothetical protein C2U54_21100 [Leclercia sp. LSNIH1]MBA0203831.1 hypothetical protein [Pectobacterium aroidearum]